MKKFNFSKKHKNANPGLNNKANNKKKIFNKLNKIEIKLIIKRKYLIN